MITEDNGHTYYEGISVGENRKVPGCKCAPSNVLYWELSDADITNCPVHFDVSEEMAPVVNAKMIQMFGENQGRRI